MKFSYKMDVFRTVLNRGVETASVIFHGTNVPAGRAVPCRVGVTVLRPIFWPRYVELPTGSLIAPLLIAPLKLCTKWGGGG